LRIWPNQTLTPRTRPRGRPSRGEMHYEIDKSAGRSQLQRRSLFNAKAQRTRRRKDHPTVFLCAFASVALSAFKEGAADPSPRAVLAPPCLI
jgi:hypothetical protein